MIPHHSSDPQDDERSGRDLPDVLTRGRRPPVAAPERTSGAQVGGPLLDA
jgi:hypothetical protein